MSVEISPKMYTLLDIRLVRSGFWVVSSMVHTTGAHYFFLQILPKIPYWKSLLNRYCCTGTGQNWDHKKVHILVYFGRNSCKILPEFLLQKWTSEIPLSVLKYLSVLLKVPRYRGIGAQYTVQLFHKGAHREKKRAPISSSWCALRSSALFFSSPNSSPKLLRAH